MRISKGAQRRADKARNIWRGPLGEVPYYHPRHQLAAHYSIHDRKHVNSLLSLHHDALLANAEKMGSTLRVDLMAILARAAKRYLRAYGMLNKYVPHQGPREMERRRIGGFYTLHNKVN